MSSRYEELLERLLNDDGIDDIVPESRAEAYLMALIKKNGSVDVEGIIIDPSMFGDATPEDVMEGKTFTSVAGQKQVGTAVDKGAMIDALIDSSIIRISSNAKTVYSYKFYQCAKLVTVSFPVATSIGVNAFYYCTWLSNLDFPEVTSIGNNAFYECSDLEMADFPAVTSIGNAAFSRCDELTTLILRSSTVATMNNANTFNGTPIASGTGYIYVPKALIEDYKVATNWSTYAAQFRALEDYTVDGTTTGALDESKI